MRLFVNISFKGGRKKKGRGFASSLHNASSFPLKEIEMEWIPWKHTCSIWTKAFQQKSSKTGSSKHKLSKFSKNIQLGKKGFLCIFSKAPFPIKLKLWEDLWTRSHLAYIKVKIICLKLLIQNVPNRFVWYVCLLQDIMRCFTQRYTTVIWPFRGVVHIQGKKSRFKKRRNISCAVP